MQDLPSSNDKSSYWIMKGFKASLGLWPLSPVLSIWGLCQYKGMFPPVQSRRGWKQPEKWLQHKSLHVFTHMQSQRGDRAETKSTPQEMVPTPNFGRQFWNCMPESYSNPHRHGKSALGPLPSKPICVNMPVVVQREYQNTPISTPWPLCACMNKLYRCHLISIGNAIVEIW